MDAGSEGGGPPPAGGGPRPFLRDDDLSPAEVVWDEAENRLHAQKALLAWLLEHSR